ncbi:helix-turn-helix domain-containing protein [Pseudoduganella eburnea]|uniref:Helix-turn-helix domain-containing protein n=1 Tax=Massilia eburnea TaxID=1776165 RepID=A0A6L6QAD6_9BURK|nr:AraC family transcriptional regulator [Massilia eburnea]MTW09352.1 helix-turn-helix domain-containing protein [Massilia eburnea]
MTQLVCPEFDAFEAALYGVQGKYVLRSRQYRDWRLKMIDLDGAAIMLGKEGASTAYSGTGMPGYFNIFVPLSAQQYTIVNGHAFDADTIGWMSPERMFHIVAERAASWLTVAIAAPLVVRWCQSHADEFDLASLSDNFVCTGRGPVPALRSMIGRILQVERDDSAQLNFPNAAIVVRAELVDKVLRAVLDGNDRSLRYRIVQRHRWILDRALELLNSMPEGPILVDDLCAATGASERTIRNVFHHYLGMSPHRYLMLYRMHRIRSAILNAGPAATVSEICGRFGVWDFGRFAQLYCHYFGVIPSRTLGTRLSVKSS